MSDEIPDDFPRYPTDPEISRYTTTISRGFTRQVAAWTVIYGYLRVRSIQLFLIAQIIVIAVLVVMGAAAAEDSARSLPLGLALIVGIAVISQPVIVFAVVYKNERQLMQAGDRIECIFRTNGFSARTPRRRVEGSFGDCKSLALLGGIVFYEAQSTGAILALPEEVFPKAERNAARAR